MSPGTDLSTRFLQRLCTGLILLGLLAAAGMLVQRVRVERACRAVDVVLDYGAVAALAGKAGLAVPDALARLRDAGATAVALPEESLLSLAEEGRISLNPPYAGRGGFPEAWNPAGAVITVIFRDASVRELVLAGLRRVYPETHLQETSSGLRIRGAYALVSELGLGLLPEKVYHIRYAGLRVAPRLKAGSVLTGDNIRQVMAALATQLPRGSADAPRGMVIFDKDRVLGFHRLLPVLAEELGRHDLVYGSVEFAKQKGDAQLATRLRGRLVRVHSISVEELTLMRPAQAVQRFTLAAKDRNIRALYVNLPLLAGDDALAEAADYVQALAHGLKDHGFLVNASSPAAPFAPLTAPGWLLALLFAGAGAGMVGWLLVLLPSRLPRRTVLAGYGVVALGVLASVMLAFAKPELGRVLFGLLAAIGFPMLALTWAYRYQRVLHETPAERPRSSAIAALLVAVALALAGGLLIAAMLSDSLYLVQALRFKGPKLALVLPALLLGAMLVTDGAARAGESLAEYVARCRAATRRFLAQPVYVGGVLLALVLLLAVAVLTLRSGNEGTAVVSMGELQMRAWLDQLLIARPRTKEFALGFPLFILAMGAAAHRRRALAGLLLLGGAVGLADVVNTFCHAHTPLLISLLRTMHGLWIGIVIGVGALMLLGWHRPSRTEAQAVPAAQDEER